MTNVSHADLTDPELHEIKGSSTAGENTVPIADGSGHSSWGTITSMQIDSSIQLALNHPDIVVLTLRFPAIATGSTQWIVSPFAGNVIAIYGVLSAAITTANETITASIGGTPISDGAIVFPYSGSAGGNIQSTVPSASNTVTAGQAISFANTGGCAGTCDCILTIVLDVS